MLEKILNFGSNILEMNNYNCLDLNIVKNEISSFASILEAKDFILNENIVYNPLFIKKNNIETKEALNLIKNNINVTFSGINNVSDLLDKADKGICLNGIELNEVLVFHNHCERIKKIFNNIDDELNIKDYADSININSIVFDKVNNCIDNTGEIKDDASSELKRLNHDIDSLQKSIYNKAEQFISKHTSSLQEQSIYYRDNRVTFLIKNSDKNKYSGYAYGSSASGLASYVEPGIFIELNNKMLELLNQKNDEILRILNELTYLIATVSVDYKRNFESLIKLNVVFSKANYGYKHNGILADFTEGKYFDFKDLCHPLLDQKTVVSNSYRLFAPYQGIVISGSNTGGKTVSLKAIGLSVVMSYLGIPIIASEAVVPFYKNVFVDIDDNQSIQDSLSTFSAHITNINNIVKNAHDDSLILIDELISGTDPKQAQAISLAILDKIKEIGSVFVITTHFDDIKNYSYNDENILLSSVGFNMETLNPTYKYYENSIGSSNALEIASRYFDDQSIINNAKEYLKIHQTKQDELLKKLADQIDETNIMKEKLDDVLKQNESIKQELNSKLHEFELEKINLRNKYIEELNDYISDIKQKANDKLEEIKDKKDVVIVKQIEELAENKIVEEKVELKVGDNVRIKDNEQIGTITNISGDNASVDIRCITVKTKLNDLTYMPKVAKKQTYVEKPRSASVPKEINLVGQRVEDGLTMMEEYLDRANGARLSNVKVIHGIGSGALRTALRNRMKKLSYIKSFKDGDFYDGGSAVTIVEFK